MKDQRLKTYRMGFGWAVWEALCAGFWVQIDAKSFGRTRLGQRVRLIGPKRRDAKKHPELIVRVVALIRRETPEKTEIVYYEVSL